MEHGKPRAELGLVLRTLEAGVRRKARDYCASRSRLTSGQRFVIPARQQSRDRDARTSALLPVVWNGLLQCDAERCLRFRSTKCWPSFALWRTLAMRHMQHHSESRRLGTAECSLTARTR